MNFSDYRPLIGNVGGNWQVRTTMTGSLPPFDASNFQLDKGAMVPESPPMVLLGLSVFLVCVWGLSHRRSLIVVRGTSQ